MVLKMLDSGTILAQWMRIIGKRLGTFVNWSSVEHIGHILRSLDFM